MCKFASFILTKSSKFWGPTDSHEDIIHHYNLQDKAARILLVRVELTPPDGDLYCSDYSKWNFRVDQDEYPEWTFTGDLGLEKRAREALLRRANAEKWFVEESGQQVIGGYGCKLFGGDGAFLTGGAVSRVTGGDESTVTGGYKSIITGEHRSTVTGGNDSTITGGACSTVTGGNNSKVTGGEGSRVTGGACSMVTGGYNSMVIGGCKSTVTGGKGSVLSVQYLDGFRTRIIIGYVGEDGIEPNVPYHVKDGKLVPQDI